MTVFTRWGYTFVKMNFADFKHRVDISSIDLCRETFAFHNADIRIKKEQTGIRNLQRIFDACLRLSNRKGFQAMTMRELSRESGLSLGALYAYFPGKDALLSMLQHRHRTITRRILESHVAASPTPREKLTAAVRTHLYLSEILQPWFYFSFMEAKYLSAGEKKEAVASDLFTAQLFVDILEAGEQNGDFTCRDHHISAGLIKAMLQDW